MWVPEYSLRKSGAFTGEISADMLVDLGVEYVIMGPLSAASTSPRPTDRELSALWLLLNAGLKVIICGVGEGLHGSAKRA